MLRRVRRPVALLAPLLVVSALASACGDATTVESGARVGSEAYTITGDVGSSPDVAWKSRMTVDDVESEVITAGDGAELAEDDQVLVNYWVGNGFTRSTTLDTHLKDQVPVTFAVGGEPAQPASPQPSETEIARYLLDAFVAEHVEAGDTVGTRKAVTVNSADVVGYGGGGFDIGNSDGLLLVVDIDAVVLEKPDGKTQPRSPKVPKINLSKKLPGSLDFSTTPQPDGKLHVYTLVEGSGEEVAKTDAVVVNYLGQVYDADEPFDASYPRDSTFLTRLGVGAVIKGWDKGLVGVTVGSRVVLEIPASQGYGKEGSGESIPGGSTLYFVIDVLAAG